MTKFLAVEDVVTDIKAGKYQMESLLKVHIFDKRIKREG
jgi:hypothetical protein